MKNLLSLLFLSLIILFCACSKNDDSSRSGDCTSVDYDTPFTIMADESFYLPDGSELLIRSLNNAFCPCLAICDWEGQMTLDVTLTDPTGAAIDGEIGTHQVITWPSDELPGLLINVASVSDSITFVTECTQAMPSPAIAEAIVVIKE